ncbi:MAG: HlyD family efflux transporter periplasmic adaptor subunit [Thermoguttaceae bacterium]|jgi:multidrug resistance efflux pump
MYDPAVLRYALVSGLIGVAAFCASYAAYVWRRRNAALAGRRASPVETCRRWSALLLAAGGLAIGLAVAVRELDRPAGVLSGDGLFAVRVPEGEFRLAYLLPGETAEEGDLLARLESAAGEAKARELNLRCRRLERERDALALEIPQLDPELVRSHQNAISSRQQLRSSVDQLLPDHESAVRQATLERLARLEKSAELDVDIAWYTGELNRRVRRREYVRRELDRLRPLVDQNAVTETEFDRLRQEADDLDGEIDNLGRRAEGLQAEKAQIARSLQQLGALAEEQQATLRGELERARSDQAQAEVESRRLAEQLAEDLARATELRKRQLAQLDLKIEETRAELSGVEQSLVVRAPFPGTVVYRDPSPRSAEQQQPVLVLGRETGFRIRARIPLAQVAALKEAGQIRLELVEPAVEPYFGGRFLRARPMPHKPGYAVAELVCNPSREVVKELLDGEKVVAKLLWRPPLVTLLPFRIGGATSLLGLAGWVAATLLALLRKPRAGRRKHNGHGAAPHMFRSHPAPARDQTAPRRADSPLPSVAQLESGAVSAMLEMLGGRLREAVIGDQLDDDLLSAVEWALDRHQVRAVRQIRAGLGCDSELEQRVAELGEKAGASPGGNGHASRAKQCQRALRIFRAIDPRFGQTSANRC